MTLLIDGRWDGDYGIGRVSREVRLRLSCPGAQTFTSKSDPLSLRGIVELWGRLALCPRTTFYSPGFTGTLPGPARQILTVWDLAHLHPDHRSPAKATYYRAVVRPAILRAGAVMTGSEAAVDELRDWLSPAGDAVEIGVIGCGISTEFVPTSAETKRRQVLLVSNMQPHKNVFTALRALALTPDVATIWVTNDLVAAKAAARSARVDGQVTFLTGVSDAELAHLYQQSACLVFPSISEGFGLPPIEAMGCGTPVLYAQACTAVATTCDVDPANIGVGAAYDEHEWATAIRQAVDTPRHVREFRHADYTWDAVAHRVAAFLRRAGHAEVGVRELP